MKKMEISSTSYYSNSTGVDVQNVQINLSLFTEGSSQICNWDRMNWYEATSSRNPNGMNVSRKSGQWDWNRLHSHICHIDKPHKGQLHHHWLLV